MYPSTSIARNILNDPRKNQAARPEVETGRGRHAVPQIISQCRLFRMELMWEIRTPTLPIICNLVPTHISSAVEMVIVFFNFQCPVIGLRWIFRGQTEGKTKLFARKSHRGKELIDKTPHFRLHCGDIKDH